MNQKEPLEIIWAIKNNGLQLNGNRTKFQKKFG